MIHLELASRAFLFAPESVKEAHYELIYKPDCDSTWRKVKQALRTFSLSDLTNTLVADGEEYGGTKGPEEPNHALLLTILPAFNILTFTNDLTSLFVNSFDSFG